MKEMIARVGDAITQSSIASVCITGEELVRCKDCKHWYELNDSDPFRGVCSIWHMLHHGDWFCADGKRKED